LRILQIISTIDRGGAELQVLSLCKGFVENGHDVKLLFLHGHAELSEEFEEIGVQVFRGFGNRNFIFQIRRSRIIAKSFQPHIVMSHLPKAELLAVCLPNHFKLISVKHNAELFLPKASTSVWRFISLALSRIVEFRTAKIVCISEAVKQFLMAKREIRNKNKTEVIHYGISWESVKAPKLRESQPSVNLVIGSIGRLVPQKNYSFLIKSFNWYWLKKPGSSLQIFGEGPLREELTREIDNLPSAREIHLKGRIKETSAAYRQFDVFVLASIYEGFGLVLLESASHGLPTLLSRIPIFEELLGRDYEGFFSLDVYGDLPNLFLRCESLKFRKFLAEDFQKRLSKFNIAEAQKKYESLFKHLGNSFH
jgi:glycosyltransferase involved in cell wall biosynthesis